MVAAVASMATAPALRWGDSRTLVIYDERYSEAKALAARVWPAEVNALAVNADIGRLWYSSLKSQIAASGERVAGVTPYAEFESIQSMAAEVGRRVRALPAPETSMARPRVFLVTWVLE